MEINVQIKSFVKCLILPVLTLTFVACSEETEGLLTTFQQELLGKAVNFSATRGGEFNHQTRTTYNDTGVFNENDLMRIFRQYALDGGGWGQGQEAYRTYYFNTKYATGTVISLGTDWRVYPGRKGKDSNGTVIDPQKEQDSITWENGKTVRFRSWTRSNYAGALSGCYKNSSGITNYYPDYSISDWVTVSGPTEQVPLTMRHVCSRIAISYRNNGSQFYKVELATSLEDYMRPDNADTNANDGSASEAGKSQEDAQAELDAVMAAYNRMCMPAGVDIEKSELFAMTKTFWNSADNDAGKTTSSKLIYLENEDPSTFYHFGNGTPDNVKNNVQRPVFGNVNQSCYLVTIPYDMSNDVNTQGNIITLPACTRFRVYLRDVNNGDGNATPGYEGNYHIFSLQDIKKNGVAMFPEGLEMAPGYSYKFYVGYRYDKLTITANDNFSWTEQDAEDALLADSSQPFPETSPSEYTWWKNTIKNAIPKDGTDFNPVFHITSEKEFIEFINLINGTAPTLTSGLYRAKRNVINEEHKNNPDDMYYHWYTSVSANKRDTAWISSAEATSMGYVLYESYHAANANQPAYSQEEYLRGAFPFYDETRDRHYTVYLDCDLDLMDWRLPSIGNTAETPFMGYFDGYYGGQVHTLRNVNMVDEYLFKYINSAAIRNLKVETTHKLSLVKEGCNTCYIVGISILANSTNNSIAERLTTNSYDTPSYVVGCIHVGDAGGPLIGFTNNLYMYGCMQAAEGIASGSGALIGSHRYSESNSWKFLQPQVSFNYSTGKASSKATPTWSRFLCNYYDTELSPGTKAVGDLFVNTTNESSTDYYKNDYSPLEYIRGGKSFILKAKNDNLLSGEVTFSKLKDENQRRAYYGLAPWKAMNYGIMRYNRLGVASTHKCNVHYENNSTGYAHLYPVLLGGVPTETQYDDPLEQNN